MENLLENLNPEQLKAVTHRDGPLMIVAGAGTGKTTVITQRIAWLIEQGLAKPENVLALTFTDKAAAEMEERVDMLLPYGYVEMQISTFHAFCESVLRQYGAEIGLSRDFRVLTEIDAWLLVRNSLDRFELDYFRPFGNPTKYLRGLLTHFSRAKDYAVMPDEYLAYADNLVADGDESKRVTELANAYHMYQQVLLENDAMDFGDLLLYTLKLLRERPTVLTALRDRFTFVLVDEFQDTNFAQYEIVKLIAAPKNNLTVVGDDDQAIYKFRGASLANILKFQTDYPDATKIVLVQNYRSIQAILDHAHTFIQKNNPNRLEAQNPDLVKKLISQKEGGGSIEHLHCSSLDEETEMVTERILQLKQLYPDASWNDFAILTRSNDAAVPFVASLVRRNVPHQFLALRGLYTKTAVLDLSAFLHVIDNPFDGPSMYRLLTLPLYGLKSGAVAEITHLANRKGKSLFEACGMARSFSSFDENTHASLSRLLTDLAKWREQAATRKVSELLVSVARDSGYVEFVNALPEREKQDSFKAMQQFFERLKRFEAREDRPVLRAFLEEFRHERDAGEEGVLAVDLEAGPEMVRIMTVHASKGLEFRFVFVVNLVDQRFPTRARTDAIPLPAGLVGPGGLGGLVGSEGDWHLEEERRLFYVAMTRAKEALFFTSADNYGGARERKLSRFLSELGYEKPVTSSATLSDPFAPGPDIEVDPDNADLIIHIPKQFSFTQLTAFRTCPLQYKFAHVFKIPVFGKWTFSYGKTMHGVLQRFFTVWLERTGSVQKSLFEGALEDRVEGAQDLPVTLEELLQMYKDGWQDDWYIDDRQREKYRENGHDGLVAYYSTLKETRPEPLFLEQGFTLKIGDVIVKGRIDRMDKLEDGVEIIDYKTGSPKEKLEKEDKEQLLLYQLAASDILGLKPKRLTFHYLENNSRLSFLGTDEDLADLQEGIVERVRQIRQSVFNPTPGFACKFCDFADICEFRAS